MNYHTINSRLNDDVDPVALDALARNNTNAKQKQFSMMKNYLLEASGVIGGYNNSKIEAICTRLQSQGFGLVDSKRAFELMPERFDKFPSFKDIKALIAETRPRLNDANNRDKQCEVDEEKYHAIKKMFLEKADQDKLTKYTQWWLKEVYYLDASYLPDHLNISMFEMPALFDWYDVFGQWSLDRIRATAIKKNNYIIDCIAQNKKIEAYTLNNTGEYKKFIGEKNVRI